MKVPEGEYASREFGRRHLAPTGEGCHGLVVEQTVGQAVEARWLDPAILEVELYECDALQELPGDGRAQGGAWLGAILTHDEPHLRGRTATSRTAHALQERTHREGRVDLEGTLEATDVDAEFEGGRGDGRLVELLVAHDAFRALAHGRREVAVMDEETVRLVVGLAIAA